MTQRNNFTIQGINRKSLITRMLIGGGIGLIVISLFLSGTGEPNPEWGKFWMLRPLIIVPIATAFGSLSFYSIDFVGSQGTLKRVLAFAFSIISFVISLWLGIVLGLDGTLWN